MKKNIKRRLLSIAAVSLLVLGCGSDSSSNNNSNNNVSQNSDKVTAYYLDAPIEGVTVTDINEKNLGKTGKDGSFIVTVGSIVKFYIGSFLINTDNIVTDNQKIFESSSLMRQLLQSLDKDGDISNGIQISEEVIDYFKKHKISIEDENDIESIINSINNEKNLNLKYVNSNQAYKNYQNYVENYLLSKFNGKTLYSIGRKDNTVEIKKIYFYENPDAEHNWDKYKARVCDYSVENKECKGEETEMEVYYGGHYAPFISASGNNGAFCYDIMYYDEKEKIFKAVNEEKFNEIIDDILKGVWPSGQEAEVTLTYDEKKAEEIKESLEKEMQNNQESSENNIDWKNEFKSQKLVRVFKVNMLSELKQSSIKSIIFNKEKNSMKGNVTVLLNNGTEIRRNIEFVQKEGDPKKMIAKFDVNINGKIYESGVFCSLEKEYDNDVDIDDDDSGIIIGEFDKIDAGEEPKIENIEFLGNWLNREF